MLKPYLETGAIRFIGSTTYDDYNRYFARSKGTGTPLPADRHTGTEH